MPTTSRGKFDISLAASVSTAIGCMLANDVRVKPAYTMAYAD